MEVIPRLLSLSLSSRFASPCLAVRFSRCPYLPLQRNGSGMSAVLLCIGVRGSCVTCFRFASGYCLAASLTHVLLCSVFSLAVQQVKEEGPTKKKTSCLVLNCLNVLHLKLKAGKKSAITEGAHWTLMNLGRLGSLVFAVDMAFYSTYYS